MNERFLSVYGKEYSYTITMKKAPSGMTAQASLEGMAAHVACPLCAGSKGGMARGRKSPGALSRDEQTVTSNDQASI